jgi:hypothetical protein
MQDFDLADVDGSMYNLLLAAEEVENMDTEHPPGFYDRPAPASIVNVTAGNMI